MHADLIGASYLLGEESYTTSQPATQGPHGDLRSVRWADLSGSGTPKLIKFRFQESFRRSEF